MAAATDVEWRPAARDGDPVLRAQNTAPGGPTCATHPSRGCWVNLGPVFLCVERQVSSEHAGDGSLSGHLAGLGAMPRTGPAGVPRSILRGPGVDDNSMGCPPAPLPWAPGLPQSPCFPPGGWAAHPLGISHTASAPAGGPPECGYLLATRCRGARGPGLPWLICHLLLSPWSP